MSELIDRNALIDALMTYTWRDEDEHLIDDWDEKRRFIEDWLPSLPTIEDEPVRHGQWILPDICYEDIECSVCHAYMPIPISFDYRPTYKYCPMCGAKMDEVSE